MSKKVIVFIIILILLVIVGVVAYFMNQNSNESENNRNQAEAIDQTEENVQNNNTALPEENNVDNTSLHKVILKKLHKKLQIT